MSAWFSKPTSRLALALGGVLALGVSVQTARAQIFFRPFGGLYSGSIEAPLPRYSSRFAVARILSEEGYRLIGPLEARGDQIIAMGEDESGRRKRFLIDPYEGEVLSARRVFAPQPPLEDESDDNPETRRRPAQRLPPAEPSVRSDAPRNHPRRASPEATRSRGVASRSDAPPVTHKAVPIAPEAAPQPAPVPQNNGAVSTPTISTRAVSTSKTTTAVARPPEPSRPTPAPKPAAPPTSQASSPVASVAPAAPPILPTVKANPLLDVTRAEAEKKARKQSPGS